MPFAIYASIRIDVCAQANFQLQFMRKFVNGTELLATQNLSETIRS